MDNCIQETGNADFNQRLRGSGRLPLSVSVEVTERCNLNCQHCYINLPANDRQARERELSTEELKQKLDEMAEAGALWLLLTGGEAMLRRDFKEIYLYARSKGFIITLYTNATMITPEKADFLAQHPPLMVEVTLYGATQETYERVTQVPGSYAKCMQGIRLLAERGVAINLKTVVITLNSHELEAMKAIADELGVEFRYDALIHPRLNGDRSPTKLRLKPEEIIALEQLDVRRAEEWHEFCTTFLGNAIKDGEQTFVCGAAYNSCHLDAYGNLSPCMITRKEAISIREQSFQEAWDGHLARVRATKNEEQTACHSCQIASACTNCPGWSELERGTLEQRPIDFLCQTTQARVAAFAPEATAWLKEGIELIG